MESANHNAQTKGGDTAAELAARYGHKNIVQYLGTPLNPIQAKYLEVKGQIEKDKAS